MATQSLKRCPDCGEAYAPSYKRCPFCEEEAAFLEGEYIRRSSKRSKRHSSSYSLVTPTLIILILLMAALLVYLLFGDQIKDRLAGKEVPNTPPAASSVIEPPASSGIEPIEPDVTTPPDSSMPEDPSVTEPTPSAIPYDTVNALPTGLTLNKSDFTLPVGDPDVQLKVTNASGSFTWVSEDPAIATVDANGKVKAIANGTVNVLASDGNRKGVCIVRVRGGSAPSSGGTTTGGATTLALNKTDYTTHVGEMDVLLTLGVTNGVTWETSNAAVATVSKGLVHAEGKGTCTIKATYDGNSYECIVRVTG